MSGIHRIRSLAFRLIVLAAALAFFPASASAQPQSKELVVRGQYIFAVAGGCACHTMPDETPHTGARPFPIPFGSVYSTNITQDKTTGLGAWTDQQILDAMVKGIRPDGRRVLPVMPYEKYSGMAQEDLKALVAFLRTLEPVKKPTPELETRLPFMRGLGTYVYLKLFGRFNTSPPQAPKTALERGRYLADHVALCSDCHTPRNALGVPKHDLYMAGASQDIGPLGEAVPNITPDPETGIGSWRREDIAELLLTGIKPDFDNVQGLMDEVVQGTTHGYKDMAREDALAIADYLKSIPAVRNEIQ